MHKCIRWLSEKQKNDRITVCMRDATVTDCRKWWVDMFGGKKMDTFMDKLAQKLTAQEMIKANTAADAEEMKKLKSQVKEYQEILNQLQQLVADSTAKIENAKVDGSEINRLVEESIAKINQVQIAAQDNGEVQEALNQLKQSVEMKLNGIDEDWNELEQTINSKLNRTNESIGQLENAIGAKLDSAIGNKLENTADSVHKECVKVYRNVQAVVVEENNKQTESIEAAVKALKGKMGAILGISIAALVAALGGVVFQVLVYLQII